MTLDRWFVAANLCGAATALVVNAWDAWKGWPDFRPIRTLTAAFAAVYVVAYAVLFAGVWIGSDRARWSASTWTRTGNGSRSARAASSPSAIGSIVPKIAITAK